MRIGILSSHDSALAHGEAHDALAVQAVGDESQAIRAACASFGWTTVAIEASTDPARTIAALNASRCDVVFQLAESIGGEARFEAAAAWMLEWAKIPFTGTGPIAITIALEKPLARAVLAAAGVPTPIGFVLADAATELPREFTANPAGSRWIVKPAREDASHGIALASVVSSERALRERAAYVIATYRQPALVEEFVEGREFNVSLLADGDEVQILPPAEIDYTDFPAGAPQLVTFTAKWDPSSAEYTGSVAVAARDMDPELDRLVRTRALAAYHAIGLAGYGRIDLRVHPTRGPLVLDVNPNPDISPDAGLARAAARGGLAYEELISRIVRDAVRRGRRAAPAASV